jgi:D-alanyl-D-alanine carboxypeptidase (penicillin-binding protein 5/6)
MKTLALLTALLMHVSGLWAHVPSTARTALDNAATADNAWSAGATEPPARLGPLPVRIGTQAVVVDAVSAYAVDVDTGTVLYEKNPTGKRPIASITKLITAIVFLSHHTPDEQLAVPALPPYGPEDDRLGLSPGEAFTAGQLVQAALIPSAADAADTLAITDAGSVTKFAAQMNAKMNQWGITGTHFTNASGLQDKDNYASAEALGKIGRLALMNPFIRTTVGYTNATIISSAGRRFDVTNTDTLLSGGNFYGIKTGYTLAAGQCFLGLTRINGHEVVTVILGSSDRFGASQALAGWIDRNWQWL